MNDTKSIQEQLEQIRLSYIASLPEKRRAIVMNWENLHRDWQAESYDLLYLVIHGLAGSAETFGLPAVTQKARVVVERFKSLHTQRRPELQILEDIGRQIHELVQLLDSIRRF